MAWLLVLITSLGAAVVAPSMAQNCLVIEAVPEQTTLILRSGKAVSSIAPATFCELETGLNYLLTVSRENYERRTLKFSINNFDQPASFGGIRLASTGRSMLIPGWGQFAQGYKERGVEAFIFLGASAFKFLQAYNDYDELKEKYEFFRDQALESTQQSVIEEANTEASKAARKANALRTHTRLTAAASGWIYAENLFETFLMSSPPKVETTEGVAFHVSIPKRSRARAGFRSFLFPGLGQKYNGNHIKGLLFRSGFIAMTYFALDAKMHYDLSTIEYELAYETFEQYRKSGNVGQIAAAQADAKRKFEIKDNRKEDMYLFAAAAGTVWLLNVLDAIVFGGTEEPQERFEFKTSVKSSTVRTGLSVNF